MTDRMDIFHRVPAPDSWGQYLQTEIQVLALACILFTAQHTLDFITAVNEFEFSKKTFKSHE